MKMATIYSYSLTDQETLENVFDRGDCLMNHVIMPPGKVFPKHPTDAHVYITVLRGELTISLEDEAPIQLKRGQVGNVPKGIMSSLSNVSEDVVELIVLKIKHDAEIA